MSVDAIKNYLNVIISIRRSMDMPKGFEYSCIEEYVLKNGREFGPRVPVTKMGQQKMCFMNAFNLVEENRDLTYVEGFALSVIPIHHAWAVDAEGNVYDPTWREDRHGTATYFGVPFDRDFVISTILDSGVYGVLSNGDMANMDLLRGTGSE